MELRLPFPPSVNDMYANNKGGGRGRYPTKDYEKWKNDAAWELKAQRAKPFPVRAEIHIDLDETRQGDADNRAKPIMDALVSYGVLKNDSKKYVKRVSIGWEPVTGCRIVIREADE